MSKTAALNMRVEPEQRDLLDKAASFLHKDRSAFVIEAACREAENVLLDQRLFCLNEENFAAFEAALDAPVLDNANLKALLATPSPWE